MIPLRSSTPSQQSLRLAMDALYANIHQQAQWIQRIRLGLPRTSPCCRSPLSPPPKCSVLTPAPTLQLAEDELVKEQARLSLVEHCDAEALLFHSLRLALWQASVLGAHTLPPPSLKDSLAASLQLAAASLGSHASDCGLSAKSMRGVTALRDCLKVVGELHSGAPGEGEEERQRHRQALWGLLLAPFTKEWSKVLGARNGSSRYIGYPCVPSPSPYAKSCPLH